MNRSAILLSFAIIGCGSTRLIQKHSFTQYQYKGGYLDSVSISDAFFSTQHDEAGNIGCQYLRPSEIILPGTDRYFVLYKTYLDQDGEGLPNDVLEMVLLKEDGSGVYIQDNNERPHHCWVIENSRLEVGRVVADLKLEGSKTFNFVEDPQINRNNLRAEKARMRELSKGK